MFSQKVSSQLNNSSFIRKMFEEGDKLRAIHGADKVYDFSIGNPEIEPPLKVKKTLIKVASSDQPGMHRYMSNAGYPEVRSKIAAKLNQEHGTVLTNEHIVMTCGAAAALNVVLKSILNPGEEVIVFSPYFVEYLFYIENYHGKPVIAKTNEDTFEPDPDKLANAINASTKAIIINSPNNPTGVVYSSLVLNQVSEVIKKKEQEYGSTIFVISDEPYVKITYDGIVPPSIFKIFQNSIIVNSFSKSLALPGERIGYIAVNPSINDVATLIGCLVLCNRVLGFVNAPAIMQRLISEVLDEAVDIDQYKMRRDVLYNHLVKLGFECKKPQGTFYLFLKTFIPDDIEFAKIAQKHNILLVPGTGFGCPGYVRLSFCVSMKTIENSLPAFEALAAEFK